MLFLSHHHDRNATYLISDQADSTLHRGVMWLDICDQACQDHDQADLTPTQINLHATHVYPAANWTGECTGTQSALPSSTSEH